MSTEISPLRTWHGRYGAFITNQFALVPTMHLFDGVYASKKGGNERADFTLCGREMADGTIYLDARHASKFARKCSICDRIAERTADNGA